MLEINTYGKLYLVGEYQVLNKKGNAIVFGISKQMNFEISESSSFYYITREEKYAFKYENLELSFDDLHDNKLIKSSIKTVFEYLEFKKINIKQFGLKINSELETKDKIKYGFGSSSALISGIIKSILNLHLENITDELVFKLSVLAQIDAEEVTSGGDLAASIYGGFIYYRHYNLRWILMNIEKKAYLYSKSWPDLKIIKIKTDLKFGAIWTKKAYKTKGLKKEIEKDDLKHARKIVKNVFLSLSSNNYVKTKENIYEYQKWFNHVLEEENIIIPEIKKTFEITNNYGLATKISGAGGGDSLVFLYPEGFNFTDLKEDLEKNNLELFVF